MLNIPSFSVRQMLAIFSGVELKECIGVQEKKKKVVVLCSHSPQNVKLGIFSTKKAWCMCRVVVL